MVSGWTDSAVFETKQYCYFVLFVSCQSSLRFVCLLSAVAYELGIFWPGLKVKRVYSFVCNDLP